MSVSVFEHSFLSGLLGDAEVGGAFAAEAEIAAILCFEAALAEAEAAEGLISHARADVIRAELHSFKPDYDLLAAATARDGVVMPGLLAQMRENLDDECAQALHFGATSQDAIDTALALRLKPVLGVLRARLATLEQALEKLAAEHGDRPLTARTRMRAAIPVTVARRIEGWSLPLSRHRARLDAVSDDALRLQFSGAAGTLDKLGDKGPAVRDRLASLLDLKPAHADGHTGRDGLAALSGWLAGVSGSLGKFGQDVVLMAQDGIGEIELSGGGGSSAMPHKQNPVKAEALVTLARFNATQVSAMHHALVHEQERSGAAWTLEWMILPQVAVATAASLRTALELVGSITRIGAPDDL